MSNKILKFRRRDLIIFVIILIIISLILVSFYFTRPGKKVRVSRDGETIEEISLDEDKIQEYNFDGQTNTLKIENGVADVTVANCQNQICVNSSPISEVGEVIACLPHKLIFEVVE